MSDFTDIDQAISFFDNIPEDKWCAYAITDRSDEGRHCAVGHLMVNNRRINEMRIKYNKDTWILLLVNDGLDENYPQDTPKQRVLALMNDIKKSGLK